MIERIFHPIGQGAFYSERHYSGKDVVFTIVYDCGNSDFKLTNPVVSQAFKKDDIINILFISHFDWDHISKIKALRDHTKIERVVMPLLHKEEKILLTNIYNGMGESDISALISNPAEFFSKNDTQITIIKPTDDNNKNNDLDIDMTDYRDTSSNSDRMEFVESSKQINVNSGDWIYIPYNRDYKENNEKLIKVLKDNFDTADFDTADLVYDRDFILAKISEIIENTLKSKKGPKKKGEKKGEKKGGKKEEINTLKKIYKNLSGDINSNSMIIYSGPKDYKHEYIMMNCNKVCRCFYYHYDCYNLEDKNAACIYTGDSNLNVTQIENVYSSLWKNVGTIQIPHHGALSSFNASILQDKKYCCPISFGKNNTYGHPSTKVQSEILANNCHQVNVTDDLDSAFIQIIYNNIDFRGPKLEKLVMK